MLLIFFKLFFAAFNKCRNHNLLIRFECIVNFITAENKNNVYFSVVHGLKSRRIWWLNCASERVCVRASRRLKRLSHVEFGFFSLFSTHFFQFWWIRCDFSRVEFSTLSTVSFDARFCPQLKHIRARVLLLAAKQPKLNVQSRAIWQFNSRWRWNRVRKRRAENFHFYVCSYISNTLKERLLSH